MTTHDAEQIGLKLRMVVRCMNGDLGIVENLCEKYQKVARLHVPIGEILEWKRQAIA